jgi:hypothetical protein
VRWHSGEGAKGKRRKEGQLKEEAALKSHCGQRSSNIEEGKLGHGGKWEGLSEL